MTTAELYDEPDPTRFQPFKEVERGVNTREASEILGISASTLEKLRVTGGGPPYHQRIAGGRVIYLPSELREWRDRLRRRSTSENLIPEPEQAAV